MGYIRQHAMLVTSFREEYIQAAHQQARAIFTDTFARLVSPIAETVINGDYSFAIFPDGSKEGWDDSDRGDRCRNAFKDWLKAQRYEDGSGPYAWVEVQYGDGNWETRIVDDSDAQRRGGQADDLPTFLGKP